MTEALRLTAVTKSFGTGADAVPVLHGVDLGVTTGSLVALLGPSGCGKTTLLRLVAGFDRPDGGTVEVDGQVVTGPGVQRPPERRRIGVVPQEGAVFPHLSVRGNIGFGLPRRDRRNGRVEQMLELVGLDGFAERMPHELSGGQLQRVALARALAPNPSVVLLDEPFAALDTSLRAAVRAEVRRVVHAAGATALLVTHDQEEALSVADRVAFMWGGCVEQIGTPDEIYGSPVTVHAAEFIGDANILRMDVEDGQVRLPFGDLAAPEGTRRAAVVIRPEEIQILPGGIYGHVVSREYYGHDQVLHVVLEESGIELRVRVAPHERLGGAGPISIGLRSTPLVLSADDEDAIPPSPRPHGIRSQA
jgi:iron(III) transport system ATP-binding protein